jgi:cell division protein FtsB
MELKEELALFLDQLFTLARCLEFGAGSTLQIREKVGTQMDSLMRKLMDYGVDVQSVIIKRLKKEYAELIKEMELVEEIFKDAKEQPPLPEEIARRYRFKQNEHGRWTFLDRPERK